MLLLLAVGGLRAASADVVRPDGAERAATAPPWLDMRYGPFLSTAVGLGGDPESLPPVHKGLVVRLRTKDGAETDLMAVFDTDLMRWRAAWTGSLALRGIVFDGPHGTFPEIEGEPLFVTAALPGAHRGRAGDAPDPGIDPRAEPWGPVPSSVAAWRGLHLVDRDVVLEYTVDGGRFRILERARALPHDGNLAMVREFTVSTDDPAATTGPVLRVLDESPEALDLVLLAQGADAAHHPGSIRLPARGTATVVIHRRSASPLGVPVPAGPIRLDADRDRRWTPVVTRGVVDERLQEEDPTEVVAHSDDVTAAWIPLAGGDGAAVSMRRDGQRVESGPVDETAVIALLPMQAAGVFAPAERVGWWPSDRGRGERERNEFTGIDDLRLNGVTWRRGVAGRALDFDGTAAAWIEQPDLDHREHDLAVAGWLYTRHDGTVFSLAPEDEWVPDGLTFFVRDGRLAVDVGWVGFVEGGPRVDDGRWHHVAMSWRRADGAVTLFVDGRRVAAGTLPVRGDAPGAPFLGRLGWTTEEFPETSRLSGYLDGVIVLRRTADELDVTTLAGMGGESLAEAIVVTPVGALAPDAAIRQMSSPLGPRATLVLPPSLENQQVEIRRRRGPESAVRAWADTFRSQPERATPFRVDRLTRPDSSDADAWMRFGALDFGAVGADGRRPVLVTTWSGDLWRVDGVDETLDDLTWTRVASGLNQPFGVVVRGEDLLVLGRDQITRLVDRNGDGEADWYECFSNAARNSEHFHEPASGLLVEPDGSLLYHKAARHAKLALHDHHGTVIRVSPDGTESAVVARGFRAPIGLGRLPDGTLLGSDQEGHWTPANRINLIRPGRGDAAPFHGNGWAARPDPGARQRRGGESVQQPWSADAAMVPPLCWIHPSVDRSPSAQLMVDHPAWGALQGSILGLSYGTGEVYLVLRDDVRADDGAVLSQGGVVSLGIRLPTGLLAGRVHPETGDLYVCGLVGWSSDCPEDGGLFRVRPNTAAWPDTLNVPIRMRALDDGVELTFLGPLDPTAVADPARWRIAAWNYRRDAEYGSATYDLDGRRDARSDWPVTAADLGSDGRTVRLRIPDVEPADQVHVEWSILDVDGRPLDHGAHLTIHALHPKE